LKKKGNFCHLCCKAYPEDASDYFIQCDSCSQWIHAKCDGIDKAQLDVLE
jgi:hypothetical protein